MPVVLVNVTTTMQDTDVECKLILGKTASRQNPKVWCKRTSVATLADWFIALAEIKNPTANSEN